MMEGLYFQLVFLSDILVSNNLERMVACLQDFYER